MVQGKNNNNLNQVKTEDLPSEPPGKKNRNNKNEQNGGVRRRNCIRMVWCCVLSLLFNKERNYLTTVP